MSSRLRKMLAKHEVDLVDHVAHGLQQGDSARYRELDPAVLRARVVRLVAVFLEAMDGDRARFSRYMHQVVRERVSQGFFAYEVLAALNLIDEKASDLALQESAESQADKHLLLVSRTVSLTKDELVKVFVLGQQEAESQVEKLKRRLQKLLARE